MFKTKFYTFMALLMTALALYAGPRSSEAGPSPEQSAPVFFTTGQGDLFTCGDLQDLPSSECTELPDQITTAFREEAPAYKLLRRLGWYKSPARSADMDTEPRVPVHLAYDHRLPVYLSSVSVPVRFAQDSGDPADPPTPSGPWAWITVAAIGLTSILAGVQYILKRIPTERSEKISGIIGKILDLLTFFQADNITGKKV